MTNPIPEQSQTEIEAAAFRKLVNHLREHTEVQNIELSDPDAREIIYGMPYEEWKARYQQGPKQDHKA